MSVKNPTKYFRHPSFTEEDWTSRNPYLEKGEIGFVVDENDVVQNYKVGPGFWNDLSYQNEGQREYRATFTGQGVDTVQAHDFVHNFGTEGIEVTIVNSVTGHEVDADLFYPDLNTIRIIGNFENVIYRLTLKN